LSSPIRPMPFADPQHFVVAEFMAGVEINTSRLGHCVESLLVGSPQGATRTSDPESAVGWLPGAAVIVYTKRLPSGLMKLVAFWPSG
jgi:hypothetical protein